MSSQGVKGADVARLMAGVPSANHSLYWQIRFLVGDPAAWLELPSEAGRETLLILRDIEMDRARAGARADRVSCPADFAPQDGLSGDRETATAQAAAECLIRRGIGKVVADRTLPLIFADELQRRGIAVDCDREMAVAGRRAKDEQEVAWLREAQQTTEDAMRMACETIATADAQRDGQLVAEGELLTSERLRAEIDVYLLRRGYENPTCIVAGGPQGADCHDRGTGVLRTGEPVIIDIFPRNRSTRYWGDCTRTVVHGEIPDAVRAMHAAVCEAKAAATRATRARVTGEDVHTAATSVITDHGYSLSLPPGNAPPDYCAMVHGTGHGVGLDVHEPPLLDRGGPPLVVGDCLTIEPGLYCRSIGGIRVEDMVIVTPGGCENLNRLPEDLTWS